MYCFIGRLQIVTCICITTIIILIVSSTASSKEIPVECDVVEQHLHIKSCSDTSVTCIITEIQMNPGDYLTFTNSMEANFTSFELHISDIYAFPREIFDQLPLLQHIDLNGNNLREIPDKAFEKSSELVSIEMQFNRIKTLTDATFTGLQNLVTLDLSTNQIGMISGKAFKPLKRLEYLDLSSNEIKFLREDIFVPLQSLKTIFLNHNDITKIEPKTFLHHHNLVSLDLDGNRLENLDIEFSEMINLNALHIARNNLKTLHIRSPSSNRKNIKIRSLNLQNNYFTEMDNIEIDENFLIKSLNLDSNEITVVSDIPQYFSNLKRLSFYDNPLTEIDFESETTKMKQLRHLNLGDTAPNLHSNIFRSLEGLRSLSLAGNYLKGIDHEWFLGLNNLTELDLEMNFFKKFDYKSLFGILPSLKSLKLTQSTLNCTFLHEMLDYLKNHTQITIPKDYNEEYGVMESDSNSSDTEKIVCDAEIPPEMKKLRVTNMGVRIMYWTIVTFLGLAGVIIGLVIVFKKFKFPVMLHKWRRPVQGDLEIVVNGNTGIVQERH